MRIDRIKFNTELLRRNMTQKEVSVLAGISRATVNGVANGRSCSQETAEKIAKTLNVELKDLI